MRFRPVNVLRPRLIVLASIAGLSAWVFADALFRGGMFAFRDAAHFYYPLFELIRDEWAAGRVPLWNPYENLGMPLAANPAASVFYPGKLIFALPLEFGWAYRLYVVGHVLLAAGGAYVLARRWKASTPAAGAGALSYAFCGNVLVQHANVVFLVGAAWLPLGLLAADRMLVGRSFKAAVGFGVVLALMVTGGDPQMAYHAGLLAALYALILWRHGRRHQRAHRSGPPSPRATAATSGPLSLWERVRVRVAGNPSRRCSADRRNAQTADRTSEHEADPDGDSPHPNPLPEGEGALGPSLARHRLVLLGAAAVVGLVLAAVQVVPSVEFAARSDRAGSDVARSVYEIPSHLADEDAARRIADGLLCRHLQLGTHREHVYHFSVGPWRLAEYLWPNVSGRQYPEHRRWLDVIPAEARVWAPSLYMGLLPLVLAVGAMRFRRGRPRDRWLSWSAVLAVVASFGWFGLGWLVQEVRVACGSDPSSWLVGGPLGGLYWLLTVLLPGYVQFRYPAKLLVVAAMASSLLAARGWDRAFAGYSPRLRGGLLVLGGLSLGLAVAALAIRPWWAGWLAGVEPDTLFGPLDTAGAFRDLLGGLLQTALLCGVFWWLLGRAVRSAPWVPGVALIVVAVDLAVANGWMVVCADAGLCQQPSRLAAEIARHEAQRGDGQPVRVYRRPLWLPPAWESRGSPDRLGQAVRWDRDTLWPKYNLGARLAVGEVAGTMALRDYTERMNAGRRSPGGSADVPALWLLDGMGVRYVILRADEAPPERHAMVRIQRARDETEDFALWYRRGAHARTWAWRCVGVTPCPGGWVGVRPCRVLHYDPLRVEIEANLNEPSLVVLADQFYPGWQLDVATEGQGTRRVPIVRTGGVLRGARLEAGRHRLVYRYRPAGLFWGAAVSAIGWLVLGGIVVVRCRPRA